MNDPPSIATQDVFENIMQGPYQTESRTSGTLAIRSPSWPSLCYPEYSATGYLSSVVRACVVSCNVSLHILRIPSSSIGLRCWIDLDCSWSLVRFWTSVEWMYIRKMTQVHLHEIQSEPINTRKPLPEIIGHLNLRDIGREHFKNLGLPVSIQVRSARLSDEAGGLWKVSRLAGMGSCTNWGGGWLSMGVSGCLGDCFGSAKAPSTSSVELTTGHYNIV